MFKNHLILIARYVEINSMIPMWTISQMARELYRCTGKRDQLMLLNATPYMNIFVEEEKERKGIGNVLPLCFLRCYYD